MSVFSRKLLLPTPLTHRTHTLARTAAFASGHIGHPRTLHDVNCNLLFSRTGAVGRDEEPEAHDAETKRSLEKKDLHKFKEWSSSASSCVISGTCRHGLVIAATLSSVPESLHAIMRLLLRLKHSGTGK